MEWMLAVVLGLVTCYYMVRFYHLKANLKSAAKELREIEQNPEENRILLISFPDKDAERLLEAVNAYILLTRKERIFYKRREKELRAQIENISHDLRTPLTAIIGYLELLDADKWGREEEEMMTAVKKKAKALQSLLGNFYDLSRLEMNDYHFNLEKLDIVRLIRETSLLFYRQFEERGLSVDISMEDEPVYIQADIGAMERIIHNMLQNAFRYAETYLKIAVFRENGKTALSFENDTTVLQESEVEHLFERFYVQEKSRTSQSSGLGLTINKLLAEAMGGSVEAKLAAGRLIIVYRFEEV